MDEQQTKSHRIDGWPFRHGIHLLVLWAFAVLQPVLGEISSNEVLFFAIRTEGPWVYVAVMVAFAVLPPALLLAIEAVARRISPRLGAIAHLIATWVLVSLFVLTVLIAVVSEWAVASILLCWVLGALATAAYARLDVVRTFLTVLAPAPAVFLAVFFLSGTTKDLVFPSDPQLAQASTEVPLVMVMFDEFPVSSLMGPDGRIDAVRYPNFARLSRQATWFRNTVSAAGASILAVPAVVTGRNPRLDKLLPFPTDHPDSLFTMLGRSHEVNGIEYRLGLCPRTLCPNTRSAGQQLVSLASSLSVAYLYALRPPRLGVNLPGLGSTPQEAFRAKDVRGAPDAESAEVSELRRYPDLQFERFLSRIKPVGDGGERPPLHYLHVGLPHFPWVFTSSGKVYTDHFDDLPGLEPMREIWGDDPNLVRQGFQRHLMQVELVDRLVGRLLRKLKRTGLYDRSVVAIVADHGVSFRAGGNRRAIGKETGADIGLVPFFLKAPGQSQGRTVDRLVRAVDVLPTIADALGASVPRDVDGHSAFSGREPASAAIQGIDPEPPLRFSKAELERQRARTLREKISLFGLGSDRRGLFGLGAGRELVGRQLEGLPLAAPGRADVKIDRAEEFDSVDPPSRFVPALIKGVVVGEGAGEVHDLAISVNGRIAAAGPTYELPGTREKRFSLVVPESAFRAGDNDVRAFAVTGGFRLRLVPLAADG